MAFLMLNSDLNGMDDRMLGKLKLKLLRIEELIDLENDINRKS